MSRKTIVAETRLVTGKKNYYLRKAGIVPAIVYGHGKENQLIQINLPTFQQVFNDIGKSQILDLEIANKKHPVLIHHLDYDKVSDQIIHIDFYQVKMDESITTAIPVHYIGQSKAVYVEGGQLITNVNELTVECLPADLPPQLEVDISAIEEIGQSLKVKDITIDSTKVKIDADPELVLAVVEAIVEQPAEEETAESSEIAPESSSEESNS